MVEIRHVLCPVDFSDFSRRALDHAIALAKWYGSRLSVLYVYHPILDQDLPNLVKIEALGRLVADLVSSDHRVLVHCRMGFNRSVLVIATALTYLGMTGEAALVHLRECRPGALFNENFANHVATLPARRIRVETL